MKILLITVRKRAGGGAISRREVFLDGVELHIGRGVAMEICLPDIDVDFHHATLRESDGQLELAAVNAGGLEVGGRQVAEVTLAPGTEATIGRYTFRAEPGRDSAAHTVVVEEATEPGTRLPAYRAEKRSLGEVLPSRRTLSWALSLVILLIFVAWPMSEVLTRPGPPAGPTVTDGLARSDKAVPSVMEAAWTSGPISVRHAIVGEDCGACHQRPFEMVTNSACLACHADTRNHADPDQHPVVSDAATRCASCHKEHNGGHSPTEIADAACTSCHADLRSVSVTSRLGDISGFGADHPAFQLSLIVNVAEAVEGRLEAITRRVLMDPANPPTQGSGLRFPHAKHLMPGGVETGEGKQVLGCADCHLPQADGRLMRPVEMERDCGGCHAHRISVGIGATARDLPHVNAGDLELLVRDYVAASTIQGNTVQTAEQEENASNTSRIVVPAEAEARRLVDTVFKTRVCGTCHETQSLGTGGLAQRWRVRPAILQHHWMPKARFDHGPHEAMDCVGCHAATGSNRSSDVLMPGIEMCRGCHAGETRAETGCVHCHGFHMPGRTPMSPEHARIFRSRATSRQRSDGGG